MDIQFSAAQVAEVQRERGEPVMDDVAALNIRVSELEARLQNHETRLPPEPKCEDPNFAYSTQLTYWVRPLNPVTPNSMNSGLIGLDGPHNIDTARTRVQAVALERAKHYGPSSNEPWPVRSVTWRDRWQDVRETGVVLCIEQLEVNGRFTHEWTYSNAEPSWINELQGAPIGAC
jgi:hypothetical protein